MRKYDRTPMSASRSAAGLSAAYLEADLDEEEDYENDDGGEGLTATERARAALARPRRIDEAAEVLRRPSAASYWRDTCRIKMSPLLPLPLLLLLGAAVKLCICKVLCRRAVARCMPMSQCKMMLLQSLIVQKEQHGALAVAGGG